MKVKCNLLLDVRVWDQSFYVRRTLYRSCFEETYWLKKLQVESIVNPYFFQLNVQRLQILIYNALFRIPNFDENPDKSTIQFFVLHQMPKSIHPWSSCLISLNNRLVWGRSGYHSRVILFKWYILEWIRSQMTW